MLLGNVLPTALMIGLGYIIAKLLVIGLIAVKSSFSAGGFPGLAGGFLGHQGFGAGGYGAGGYGAGGYGAGYGGYGAGGYGGGGDGGWRADLARSAKSSSAKWPSLVLDLMNQVASAIEKHEKVSAFKESKSAREATTESPSSKKSHRRR